MTLAAAEFLRRFFLHVLPKGFVCIRHFGFLANRRRATLLPLCFQLLGTVAQSHIEQGSPVAKNSSPLWRCPKCGGKVVVIERLTPAQIQLRSPPGSQEPLHETPNYDLAQPRQPLKACCLRHVYNYLRR